MQKVYICDYIRTPIGRFSGALAHRQKYQPNLIETGLFVGSASAGPPTQPTFVSPMLAAMRPCICHGKPSLARALRFTPCCFPHGTTQRMATAFGNRHIHRPDRVLLFIIYHHMVLRFICYSGRQS